MLTARSRNPEAPSGLGLFGPEASLGWRHKINVDLVDYVLNPKVFDSNLLVSLQTSDFYLYDLPMPTYKIIQVGA
jgi:hypothetical protein